MQQGFFFFFPLVWFLFSRDNPFYLARQLNCFHFFINSVINLPTPQGLNQGLCSLHLHRRLVKTAQNEREKCISHTLSALGYGDSQLILITNSRPSHRVQVPSAGMEEPSLSPSSTVPPRSPQTHRVLPESTARWFNAFHQGRGIKEPAQTCQPEDTHTYRLQTDTPVPNPTPALHTQPCVYLCVYSFPLDVSLCRL